MGDLEKLAFWGLAFMLVIIGIVGTTAYLQERRERECVVECSKSPDDLEYCERKCGVE